MDHCITDWCDSCHADECDCGCSSCMGEFIPTCLRCGRTLAPNPLPQSKRDDDRTWTCGPGCKPVDPILRRPEAGQCPECERIVPARSMVATADDAYCSAECAGRAAIKAVTRTICPVCQNAPGVPRFGGACDDLCQAHLGLIAKGEERCAG